LKLRKLFFFLITTFIIIVTGCSNDGIEKEEKIIKIQKRVGDENNFEDIRIVTNSKQVQKVNEILNNTDWEDAKVNMVRPPDYRFIFQYKNSEIEAKAVGHELWVSPNNNTVEIVKETHQYAQLSKENSAILYEILTGDKFKK
jgi:CO dehydrogenase nickel-insertion accessory protein CooC1